MAGFTVNQQIDRTPEDVFTFVTDLDNLVRWLPRVTRAERLSGGPLSVGSRYRETRLAKGRESTVEMEVKEFEPPRTYSTGFAAGGYEATYSYSFQAEDAGTRVRLAFKITGQGLQALMAPIVSYAIKRQDKKQLKRLKEAVEGDG